MNHMVAYRVHLAKAGLNQVTRVPFVQDFSVFSKPCTCYGSPRREPIMEQHRPGDVELVNLTVHPKPLGTLVDYRCRFRVGPVTLPFQQASSEVMLKLLTWDHSVKSKDINGKVTPPPAPHHH